LEVKVKITAVSHQEPFITSSEAKGKFLFWALIEDAGDYFYCRVNLQDKDSGAEQVFEEIFGQKKEALTYINSVISVFNRFTLKLFVMDEAYEIEQTYKWIKKWMLEK
jgi:hypothetical protein